MGVLQQGIAVVIRSEIKERMMFKAPRSKEAIALVLYINGSSKAKS